MTADEHTATSRVVALAERLGMHALRVSRAGEPVLAFGDQGRPVMVHSIRKSFISALFGQVFARGLVAPDTTLSELDIDDTPALTATERSATVRDRPAAPTRPARTGVTATGTSTSWATATNGSHTPVSSWPWAPNSPNRWA